MASEHDRRLAEYEREVGDLQSQLKALEEEVVVLRRRLQDAPEARAHPRGAGPRDEGPARPGRLPERASLGHAPRGARAHRRAARRGREAHDAAVGIRHVPRRRTTTAPSTSSPPAARCGCPCTPRSSSTASGAGPGGRAQRVAQRRARPRRRRLRRGRRPQGADDRRQARADRRPRRRGARVRARRRR